MRARPGIDLEDKDEQGRIRSCISERDLQVACRQGVGREDKPARGDGKAHARQQQKAELGSSRRVEDAGQIQGLWARLGIWERAQRRK